MIFLSGIAIVYSCIPTRGSGPFRLLDWATLVTHLVFIFVSFRLNVLPNYVECL
jgi:hypothetical protein